MSLFDGLPLGDPAPAAPVPISKPYMVTLKRASNGMEILLCNVSPPPDAALKEAKNRKLALFTFDEIAAMRKAGADSSTYIDLIISTRAACGWGGPIIYQETA